MESVAVSCLGSLLVIHRDNPSETDIRRRLCLLLWANLPASGMVEAWSGDGLDEVHWRVVCSQSRHYAPVV
jgi:hypothetical protein